MTCIYLYIFQSQLTTECFLRRVILSGAGVDAGQTVDAGGTMLPGVPLLLLHLHGRRLLVITHRMLVAHAPEDQVVVRPASQGVQVTTLYTLQSSKVHHTDPRVNCKFVDSFFCLNRHHSNARRHLHMTKTNLNAFKEFQ